MKTNVMILKVTDGKNVLSEIVGKEIKSQYEYDPEHDWEYCVHYFLGIDDKTYINFNGSEYVKPAANGYSEYIYDYPGTKERGGKRNRKGNRAHRVSLMTSHLWAPDGMFGKNRQLRRRMYPSPEMLKNADEYLPF